MTELTGAMVYAERKRRKMSRQAFAELVGLTPTKVRNIEQQGRKGGRDPRPREVEMILPHISPEVLASGGIEVPPASRKKEVAAATSGHSSGSSQPVVLLDEDAEDEGGFSVLDGFLLDEEDLTPSQPVVLLNEDEIEDDSGVAVTDVTIGSGLPVKYAFELEGYHVTNSELRTLKRCRRKWYLSYYRELRLRRQELTGARPVGTRLHLALASHYSTRREDPRAVLEATIREDRAKIEAREFNAEELTQFDKEAELARIMLEGYLEWIAEEGKDVGLEVIGDEMIIEAPFRNDLPIGPVILAGKLDVRLRRQLDGARLFMDHKSTGSLTEPLKTLKLDEQMLHYHLLEYLDAIQRGDETFEHAQGGYYNMLKKVKRTARANPPFFAREEIRHNIHELNSYWTRVWEEVADISRLRERLDAGEDHRQVCYPNPGGTCSWDCDFLPVCHMFDDGSAAEAMLDAVYERHDPHDHYYPYGENAAEES